MKKLVSLVLLFATIVGCSVRVESTDSRPSEAFKEEAKAESVAALKLKTINLKDGVPIYLTSEVTSESAKAVIEGISKANAAGKPAYLLIDSPGGSVVDGAHIISAIQASKVPVNTVCLELCASMAAMILEYGTNRYAVDRSIVMFHPASLQAMVSGELDKIVSRFQFLQHFINKMDRYVAQRSKQEYVQFKALSMKELWIDAEDAKANNLIDAIVRLDHLSSYKQDFGSNKMRQNINLEWLGDAK